MQNDIDLIENKSKRFPVVLLVDTSGSMTDYDDTQENYTKIERVNEALVDLKRTLIENNKIADMIDIAVVSFDSNIKVVQDFVNIQDFNPPKLVADGMTRLCGAVQKAVSMLEERKQKYKKYQISYSRPLIFAYTDGVYNDDEDEEETKYIIQKGKEDKKFLFRAAVLLNEDEDEDDSGMGAINNWDPSPNNPNMAFSIKAIQIAKLFQVLSTSISKSATANPEDQEDIIDSTVDELKSADNAEGDNDA